MINEQRYKENLTRLRSMINTLLERYDNDTYMAETVSDKLHDIADLVFTMEELAYSECGGCPDPALHVENQGIWGDLPDSVEDKWISYFD